MKTKTLSLLSLGIVAVLMTQNSYATITTYTDRTTFINQLQAGYFIDDFSNLGFGSLQTSSTVRSGNGFSVTYSAPPEGLYSVTNAISTNTAANNLVATFGSGIYAAGGYFYFSDINGNPESFPGFNVSAFANNGIDPNAILSSTASQNNFFGWISDTPLLSLAVTGGGTTPNRWNTLDDLIVGIGSPTNNVPEPNIIALLSLAVISVFVRRKLLQPI